MVEGRQAEEAEPNLYNPHHPDLFYSAGVAPPLTPPPAV